MAFVTWKRSCHWTALYTFNDSVDLLWVICTFPHLAPGLTWSDEGRSSACRPMMFQYLIRTSPGGVSLWRDVQLVVSCLWTHLSVEWALQTNAHKYMLMMMKTWFVEELYLKCVDSSRRVCACARLLSCTSAALVHHSGTLSLCDEICRRTFRPLCHAAVCSCGWWMLSVLISRQAAMCLTVYFQSALVPRCVYDYRAAPPSYITNQF